jgi:hypothetical protein
MIMSGKMECWIRDAMEIQGSACVRRGERKEAAKMFPRRLPAIHDAKLKSFLMPMAGSLEGLAYLNGCPLTLDPHTLSALKTVHGIARVNVIRELALQNRRHHGL